MMGSSPDQWSIPLARRHEDVKVELTSIINSAMLFEVVT
jgi:hypothetical protein